MKKLIYTSLLIHFVIVVIFTIIIYFLLPNTKTSIENNIVKIEKEAEIIPNFQDKLENNLNPSKTILTGFFIDKTTIITANHGVNSKDSIYFITDSFGNTYTGSLISKDKENDLATLKIDGNFNKFSEFNFAKKISVDDEVYFINSNGEKKYGKILKLEGNKIYSNLTFQNGDSGSPLLNKKNEVLGVSIEVNGSLGVGITYRE